MKNRKHDGRQANEGTHGYPLIRTTLLGSYREFYAQARWWSVFRVRAGRPCREFLRIFAVGLGVWLVFVAASGSHWNGPRMAETWLSCAIIVGLGARQAVYGFAVSGWGRAGLYTVAALEAIWLIDGAIRKREEQKRQRDAQALASAIATEQQRGQVGSDFYVHFGSR